MRWPNLKIQSRPEAVLLGIAVLFATSCATTEGYKSVIIPAYAGAYFSECSGKDGRVSIEMYESERVQQIFDADWSADSNGNYSLASYSPLGQTIFQLDYTAEQRTFKQTGKTFKTFEHLSVGSSSILELDGHPIGLRSDEVTCLLNHKLPQRWLKKIIDEESDAIYTRLNISDSDRLITISLPRHGNQLDENWRVSIAWSLYWGFKKLSLDMKLLKNEQALVLRAKQFDTIDVRIIAQEE